MSPVAAMHIHRYETPKHRQRAIRSDLTQMHARVHPAHLHETNMSQMPSDSALTRNMCAQQVLQHGPRLLGLAGALTRGNTPQSAFKSPAPTRLAAAALASCKLVNCKLLALLSSQSKQAIQSYWAGQPNTCLLKLDPIPLPSNCSDHLIHCSRTSRAISLRKKECLKTHR